MVITIKKKLIALGALAIMALSCSSGVSVLSSMHISRFNDMARVTQSNKVMTTRMITHRQTLLAQYYAAILNRDRSRNDPQSAAGINETIEKMKDMTERLVGRNLAYLNPESINQALTIGADMAQIMQQKVPGLIEAHAEDAAFASTTTTMLKHISDLTELQGTFDDAVAEDLSDISDLVKAETDNASQNVLIVFSVALVILALLLTGIVRSITRPISSITHVMQALAKGELDVHIPDDVRRDEIGTMIEAVRVFKQNAIDNAQLTEAKALEQEHRDRRQAAMDRHTQEFGASISGVMGSLVRSAGDVTTAATEMSEASKRTTDRTSTAVEGGNNSSLTLNAVAVAAEQMAASVSQISAQVAQVTAAVTQAVDRALITDAKVSTMSEAANRIGDVVKLITTIAGQTNLLALNATIEAARAGDAGKGFAVVAGEVKNLASQTARATEQIGTQIAAIRGATGEAVTAVREVSSAIHQVEAVATVIAGAVEQQATATQAISTSVKSVSQATIEAAQAMELVLTIAERTHAISQSVLSTAGEVGQTSDTLRAEVTDFLAAMTKGDTESRRAYERIPGNGATVSLHIPGQGEVRSVIRDISLGGISLTCSHLLSSGSVVAMNLPTGEIVSGRAIRSEPGVLGISFKQDDTTLARLRKALDLIEPGPNQANEARTLRLAG